MLTTLKLVSVGRASGLGGVTRHHTTYFRVIG